MTAADIGELQPDAVSASRARKRRIELRSKQRRSEGDHDSDKRVCIRDEEDTLLPEEVGSDLQKPSIRGIKKQARYHPGVPMTRDELVAWRKEARRVRNRESAAASRHKTRARIDELESEVDVLQGKYSAALQRIVELEAAAAVHQAATPTTLPQDATIVSPSTSALSSPQHLPADFMMTPPAESFALSEENARIEEDVEQDYQHINEMNLRPYAL